ncbi:hypothetical protein QWT69_16140 [Sporosarcina oncorhynchi]|uniref:DNA mismatch repair proteins mutS family domain-containing protein n=1 Tax=Sporosarcina oncorhynchi TaxID=3056444 RepID=A0ABZ0L5Z4_9BACL|nr:hypothetical protein [Sporosarcina sp. T2O-4]WOV87358.1 hypothetical protein QWT69_16140 [Sporosarcina sp. T2O-4]
MNYTQTSVGSEYLLNQLRDIKLSQETLEEDEKLYRAMEIEELREKVLLPLSKLGKHDFTDSSAFFYGNHTRGVKNPLIFNVLALLPVASIILLFVQLKLGILCLFMSFIINGIMYYRHKQIVEYGLHSVSYVANIINTGNQLAAIPDDKIQEETRKLKGNLKPLKKVLWLNNFVSMGTKGNGDFDAIVEYIRILFLLDFISYNRIIGTVSQHKENYRAIWEIIGRLDASIAVAYYRHTLQAYCVPSFTDSMEISFTNMAHPLITDPVTNSSDLGKTTLITGSNASGKSTYSKAVAINAILAQTINTVLADTWRMKPIYVATSMAVQDNVLDGDSYFIAEIKSLRRIITMLEKGKPCLSVIDELLKGTNTIERIAASAAMMDWLSNTNGINITATHDIELTEIMKSSYDNYHFTEKFKDGDIHFDYTIYRGPSNTKNAIKLLEVLAYPTRITEQANRLAEDFLLEREWNSI